MGRVVVRIALEPGWPAWVLGAGDVLGPWGLAVCAALWAWRGKETTIPQLAGRAQMQPATFRRHLQTVVHAGWAALLPGPNGSVVVGGGTPPGADATTQYEHGTASLNGTAAAAHLCSEVPFTGVGVRGVPLDHVPGVQGELVPGDIEALVGARSVAGVPSWFTLTQSRRQFAAACGVVAAEQVWQGFLDHWVNDRKAGVTVDWDARWRTWVRNEVKWHGKRTDRLRPSGQVHDLLDHLPRVPGRRGGSR